MSGNLLPLSYGAVCAVQVLSLPSFVWKTLCGQSLSWTHDFMSVDEAQVTVFIDAESRGYRHFFASFSTNV